MKRIFILALCWPLFINAQSEAVGIKWTTSLNWEQIKQKAKAENKYIFLDCYATWCGPCKLMDKNIYSSNRIGVEMNSNFISVKIQMDSTKSDFDEIKSWYKDAQSIMRDFKVSAFPTYLFFSSEGNIIHRDLGYKDEASFLTLIRDARNTEKQVYSRLERYKTGNLEYESMPAAAIIARDIVKDKELSIKIGQDYLVNYLYKLPDEKIYTKENIQFITQFIQKTNEKGFQIFYANSKKVDEILNYAGYSQSVVDYIITKDIINRRLWSDNIRLTTKPDWKKLIKIIEKKYGEEYANRTVINAQLNWFYILEDWVQEAKYLVRKIEKYGFDKTPMGLFYLNNTIWEVIFLHCKDQKIIAKAIQWMQVIINPENNPTIAAIDTYANLLYKNGRINDAIEWEEKAEKMEEDRVAKLKGTPKPVYRETLVKMKQGIPTWPDNNR